MAREVCLELVKFEDGAAKFNQYDTSHGYIKAMKDVSILLFIPFLNRRQAKLQQIKYTGRKNVKL
ncbi:unnamed protein product [Clavelina lepadiformis]|uniref:Uncharacterized protein n=1 Tax=Clavelina lepadiformis TaxID=159417 RepID=A0ABP0FUS1_CLALP